MDLVLELEIPSVPSLVVLSCFCFGGTKFSQRFLPLADSGCCAPTRHFLNFF